MVRSLLKFVTMVGITLGLSLAISLAIHGFGETSLRTFFVILTGVGLASVVIGIVMLIPGSISNPVRIPELEHERERSKAKPLKVLTFGIIILAIVTLLQMILI